jgi:NAD(P)-dependent dehydrogenase (short-subunit alcohol dehydrogenase family)
MTDTLVLGSSSPEVVGLARTLDAELVTVPDGSPAGGDHDGRGASDAGSWSGPLESWRASLESGPKVSRVVVAPWAAPAAQAPMIEIDLDAWTARSELALARWVAALGLAKVRCADDGVIVAVVDRPAPLDCAGWAPESGIADAVEALVRSLARSEGPRGVRVDAVTTPARLTRRPVVDPQPPLARFPGTIDDDVLGAVRLLLSPDAAGLTGTVLHADGGRSW